MKFEQFEKIIKEYIKFSHYEHKLNEMGLDIVDTPLYETTGFLLDNIWEAWFNDDGIDTINWWMFEYHDLDEDFDDDLNLVQEKEPGMWDEDGNVIPMNTIEDLWNAFLEYQIVVIELLLLKTQRVLLTKISVIS